MTYENLKNAIKHAIKQNSNQEITGDLLQSTLLNIVNTIGDETTRAKAAEEAIIFDVSVYNNGAVFESLQALLSSSNLNTLIPISVRHGGMTIRFIQGYVLNSNNNYVQYRYMLAYEDTTNGNNAFIDLTNWQGVEDEPTPKSKNLVDSNGTCKYINLYEYMKHCNNWGYFYKNSCSIVYDTTNYHWIYTEPIPIKEGALIKMGSCGVINVCAYILYDRKGEVVSAVTYDANDIFITREIIIPSNVHFIAFSIASENRTPAASNTYIMINSKDIIMSDINNNYVNPAKNLYSILSVTPNVKTNHSSLFINIEYVDNKIEYVESVFITCSEEKLISIYDTEISENSNNTYDFGNREVVWRGVLSEDMKVSGNIYKVPVNRKLRYGHIAITDYIEAITDDSSYKGWVAYGETDGQGRPLEPYRSVLYSVLTSSTSTCKSELALNSSYSLYDWLTYNFGGKIVVADMEVSPSFSLNYSIPFINKTLIDTKIQYLEYLDIMNNSVEDKKITIYDIDIVKDGNNYDFVHVDIIYDGILTREQSIGNTLYRIPVFKKVQYGHIGVSGFLCFNTSSGDGWVAYGTIDGQDRPLEPNREVMYGITCYGESKIEAAFKEIEKIKGSTQEAIEDVKDDVYDVQHRLNKISGDLNLKSKWFGLKVGFLGDSLTAGYTTWVKTYIKLTGCVGLDYGIGGTHIARVADGDNSFDNRCLKMVDDLDLVIVFGGTNDFGHTRTAPFGSYDSFKNLSINTFYSGLNRLFSRLYDKYRGKPIVVITPIHHGYEVDTPEFILDNNGSFVENTNPTSGKTFKEYVNAIKEVAALYSFVVIDAYSESGLNPILEDSSNRYYFADGLHLSKAGGERLATYLYPKLEEVFDAFYKSPMYQYNITGRLFKSDGSTPLENKEILFTDTISGNKFKAESSNSPDTHYGLNGGYAIGLNAGTYTMSINGYMISPSSISVSNDAVCNIICTENS